MAQHEQSSESSPRGVCILTHGINGVPDDLDELGAALRAHGYSTQFLTLPGHGTTIQDFARSGWDDWLATVEAAADAALAEQRGPEGRPVIMLGHSLGAALTLAAASRRPALAGIVAMCPPVRLAYAMEPAMNALVRVTPFLPALGEDIRDVWRRLGPRRPIYRWSSTAAMRSLVRALPGLRRQAPQVTSPAVVIAARHDHVVPVRDGREAYDLLGSQYKRFIVLSRSFHAVARDVERRTVFEVTLGFCDEVVAAWPARPRMEGHHEWWTGDAAVDAAVDAVLDAGAALKGRRTRARWEARGVQKWDYLIVWLADARHAQEVTLNGAPFAIPQSIARERGKPELAPLLAYLGAQGWELTGAAFSWTLIFKRPQG